MFKSKKKIVKIINTYRAEHVMWVSTFSHLIYIIRFRCFQYMRVIRDLRLVVHHSTNYADDLSFVIKVVLIESLLSLRMVYAVTKSLLLESFLMLNYYFFFKLCAYIYGFCIFWIWVSAGEQLWCTNIFVCKLIVYYTVSYVYKIYIMWWWVSLPYNLKFY